MSWTLATWTGTFEDGNNSTPLAFDDAAGHGVAPGEIVKVRANWTSSTEAAGITYIAYGDATGVDDLIEDTLVAGEVETNAAYVSPTSVAAVSDTFSFVMKCDTGSATATGSITFVIHHDDTYGDVRRHTIDATGNPSDA